MPNGVGKNWSRLCHAVNGFRIKYRRWPTQVRMSEPQIDDVKSVFTPESFQKLQSRIRLIVHEEIIVVAEDQSGRRYVYPEERFKRKRGVDATTWLGVEPDAPPWDTIIVFNA